MGFTVRVPGLRDLVRACDVTELALGLELRTGLLDVAQIVVDETESLMGGSDVDFGGKTIAGVKARISPGGSAFAQQQLRKSRYPNRRRDNFGPLQMTEGFIPAVQAKQGEIETAAETTVASIVERHFR